MYKENDKLVLLNSIGVKESSGFIEKGSKVKFLKAIDTPDVTKSYVQVMFKDRVITVPELSVAFENPKMYDKAMKEFNLSMIKKDPYLKIHHPNPFIKYFYRLLKLLGLFKKKEQDLSKVKDIINEES